MAMKLVAGEVGRSDLFSVFPEFILAEPGDNSRRPEGHTPEHMAALAESILLYGQQQAVTVRRIEGNKVKLVAGYGRHAAIALLNKTQRADNPIKVLCRVVDCNPEEAFIRSIRENIDRNETTPLDDAYAQRRLRGDFGWEDAKIADFYKKSVSYVSQLRKTLQLTGPIQEAVANGQMAVSSAFDLAELPEAEREQAVAEATHPETGKVSAEVIRKKVRQKKIENGEGGKGRSLKELRTYFEEKTGPAETEAIRNLAERLLEFVAGKITDRQMDNAFAKNCLS